MNGKHRVVEESITTENDAYKFYGYHYFDKEHHPLCWWCNKATDTMFVLQDIDDDCMDEYLCSDCIKKLFIIVGNEQ